MTTKIKYEPGIELDRMIAEKIFGWKRIPLDPPRFGLSWYYEPLEGCMYFNVQKPLRYSTNLKAAWRILELFQYADVRKNAYHGTDWTVYLKSPVTEGFTGSEATGVSAAHAICLAALRSVGVIIEEEVQDGSDS